MTNGAFLSVPQRGEVQVGEKNGCQGRHILPGDNFSLHHPTGSGVSRRWGLECLCRRSLEMLTHLMGEGRLRPTEGGRAACGAHPEEEESRVTPGLLSLEVQAGSSGGRWREGQDTAAAGPGEERRRPGKLGQGARVSPALPAS